MSVNFAYEASLPNQTIDACLCCGYVHCKCHICPKCDGDQQIPEPITGKFKDCPTCEGLGVVDDAQPMVGAIDNPCAVGDWQ